MKLNRAILLSLIFHIALAVLLVFNFQFVSKPIKQSGAERPQIQAKAINSQRVEQLVKKLKQEKLNKKRQEKKRLDKLKKAEEEAKRRRKQEEKKAEDARRKRKTAEQNRKLEEKKAADLKKKRIAQEKARKKKAEAERKRKAELERKKKAEAERKRKADAERKKKEAAERKRKAEEKARQEALDKEMQAQMEAESAELDAAHRQQVLNEVDKFVTLIRGKIYRNWIEPEQQGYCIFKLQVSQGGLVIGLNVVEGAPQHCDSGQRAIYKSEPLPISKDPDVFAELKSINLTLGEKQQND